MFGASVVVVVVGGTVVVVVVVVGAAVVVLVVVLVVVEVVVVVGAGVVVVVVGAAVVVVVVVGAAQVPDGPRTWPGGQVGVPVQLPGGMQRELPLPWTQQTQPGLHLPGFVAQETLPQYACVT
jgi:hypothetical protein